MYRSEGESKSNGCSEVYVCGSFDGWACRHRLEWDAEQREYVAVVHTTGVVGEMQYKFVVDGEWRVSLRDAVARDDSGNENNVAVVDAGDEESLVLVGGGAGASDGESQFTEVVCDAEDEDDGHGAEEPPVALDTGSLDASVQLTLRDSSSVLTEEPAGPVASTTVTTTACTTVTTTKTPASVSVSVSVQRSLVGRLAGLFRR